MPVETDYKDGYSIIRDRSMKTVWINGRVNCLGRFSPLAYEIYRALEVEPVNEETAKTDTLSVKITTLNEKDWENFKTLMKENHDIDLSEEECPLSFYVVGSHEEEE